ELLGSEDSRFVPIENLDRIFEERTIDIRNLGLDAPQRPTYENPFSHLSRPHLRDASKAINAREAFSFIETPDYDDYVKRAADRTIRERRAIQEIDGKRKVVDLDLSQWQDSGLSGWGYGDILYVRPIQGTENELRKKHERAAAEELKNTPFTPFSSGGGDARVSGYLLSNLL